MRRTRWIVAVQLLLWCLFAPLLILMFWGEPGLSRVVCAFLLISTALGLYFFNFKLYEESVKNAVTACLYLLVMAVIAIFAFWAMSWAVFYGSAVFLGETI